jgi:PadR family transcriptional regulator AphA
LVRSTSSEIRLTPTSYIVLGLVEAAGEATPYDLKKTVAEGIGNFWSLQHAQLYTEPQRLTEAGYLSERRETSGRRRRHYKIAPKGREAMREWLAEPTAVLTKGHVPSLLKLVLGADPKREAEAQLPPNQEKLAEFEQVQAGLDPSAPKTLHLTIEAGVEQQRELVRYWTRLASGTGRLTSSTSRPPVSDEIRLTPNSYFVFSLLENMGEATPYQLKNAAMDWDFWSLHHAQLYTEPKRLAEAGYLSERRETGGRRRKYYKVTSKGREALQEWLAKPTEETHELRDLAVLKLFFGADPKRLAQAQLPAHREKLAEYELLLESFGAKMPTGARLALEAGIGHERVWVEFWERLARDEG